MGNSSIEHDNNKWKREKKNGFNSPLVCLSLREREKGRASKLLSDRERAKKEKKKKIRRRKKVNKNKGE